ncbi:hypothetical protein OBE_11485, partial [human gut metagenome]
VISCVYIYLFGIVQVVHVSADNEREIEVSIPEATTSAETEKTPETTTIKLQDDKKPNTCRCKGTDYSNHQGGNDHIYNYGKKTTHPHLRRIIPL